MQGFPHQLPLETVDSYRQIAGSRQLGQLERSGQFAPVERFNLFTERDRLKQAMRKNNFSSESQQTVFAAFNFAAHHHLENYRESGEHMMTHLLALAHRLIERQGDARHVAGALLHDVVEEAHAPFEEIEGLTRGAAERKHEAVRERRLDEVYEHFGTDIGSTVENLTQLPGEDFGSYAHRILYSGDYHAIAIKIQDVLHNIETIRGLRESKRESMLANYAKFYEVAARLDTRTAEQIRLALKTAGSPIEIQHVGGHVAIVPSRLMPGWLIHVPVGERPLAIVHAPVTRPHLIEVGMPFDEAKGWDRAYWRPRLKAIGLDSEGKGIVDARKPDARYWPRKFGDRVYYTVELAGRDHEWLAGQVEQLYREALGE
ncbi:hypothetical protein AUJ14_03205 [Candidatus Micrarchaeota archaeon CG1_02_55_22]|nr:MAG: hypothetical protein AUJ14_03205 [Candidatus Micrarchaeota archaeon CG1_02_55_22]